MEYNILIWFRLRQSGLLLRFITNTTKESKSSLLARLTRMGFTVESKEVFTSLTAAKSLVEKKKLRPLLFLEDSVLEDFEVRRFVYRLHMCQAFYDCISNH